MINKLKNLGRLNITVLLIAMSLFCLFISIARYFITDTKVFLFLNWNLFLAFIPWVISSFMVLNNLNKKFSLIILIISWILFFPNSPYILTDLFHLRLHGSVPIWFDLIQILSFAWTGLVYGFISLMDIEKLLSSRLNKKWVNSLVVSFLFLSSFGIYLGRYLRWNSWDIISNPLGLAGDIFDRFVNPSSHPRTWGMTLLMGVLLNMMYFSIKFIKPSIETKEI
ncbi:DUF1361 domain-containing protein [Pedobacter paludis]|uniref:DUF1361 domain-containing protein n=1 Tax=Pedobacter paludis TaxID=2203212 RepID=A0A317F035_9SPHI|nr:DUF1361 domain-containing protein [Pedobacter paludis]PWS30828.1 DUF1361 domain-containing protein [Pedobacter paludis]